MRIAIPPFSEQRRIVEEIERRFSQLDTGVAALERAKANLKNYPCICASVGLRRPVSAN